MSDGLRCSDDLGSMSDGFVSIDVFFNADVFLPPMFDN